MKVLLYYKYVRIPDPAAECDKHRELCQRLELKGRILISAEGINGTCSGMADNIEKYKDALNAHPLFSGIAFKESDHAEHAFKKLFVRLRPEIVSLHHDANPEKAAAYITPEELHDALERHDDFVLVDMRNDYEATIGRFRNAVTLPMKNFRDLPVVLPMIENLKTKRIVTYCTGGIRCEKASAFLKAQGFTDVQQLEGGIVKYCETYPDGHFDGSLFVFDDRRRMRFPGKKPQRFISSCSYCSTPTDRYIDCAELPCHTMFVCCETCEGVHSGFCEKHAKAVTV